MSDLADLSLPRVVLLTDLGGVDSGQAATAFAQLLRTHGREVDASALDGEGPVAARALRALAGAGDLLVLTAPGLLAPLDARGGNLADAGTALRYKGISTGVVLGIGPETTGATHALALHAEVLRGREIPLLGALSLSVDPQGATWSTPEQWGTMAL